MKSEKDELEEIFGGKGCEPLTDELIEQLVARGWPRSDLLWLRAQGWVYSRLRHSCISPVSADMSPDFSI